MPAPQDPTMPPADTSIDSFVRAVGRAPEIPLGAMRDAVAPGDVLGGTFRIDRELGRGGMGVVYAARDLQLERDVAIKVMRGDRWPLSAMPRVAAIFDREAKATARLNHPGIVTLYGAGKDDRGLYLVLELLRGASLVETLAHGPLAPERAVRIVREVVAALGHAHGQGILHRDLKPQNVFVTDGGRAMLLDFGLASLDVALADDARAAALSRAGTPAYMAPEQWRGDAQDERTDLWAAGVLLCQLVTGRLPLDVHGADELERALPITPSGVAAPIAAVITRATAWRPADRYGDASEMLGALDALEAPPSAALPAARVRTARRRRVIASLAAAGLAVGGYLAYRALTGGPGPLPTLAEGEWRSATTAEFPVSNWHGVIRRVDDHHYRIVWQTAPWRTARDPEVARNEGQFELQARDDGWRLVGDPRDPDGWCCGRVGHVEYRIEPDGSLLQVEALWGDRRDHFTDAYAQWRYERVGPIDPNAPP
jgi:hypothetical protein